MFPHLFILDFIIQLTLNTQFWKHVTLWALTGVRTFLLRGVKIPASSVLSLITIINAIMTVMIPFNSTIYGRSVPSSDARRREDRSIVVELKPQ